MRENDEFNAEDLDDEKTVEFIKAHLPQELKERFTDDDLYYMIDLIDEYYASSGVLDNEPDSDGCIEIDMDKVVEFLVKEAKKDGIGTFEHDEILFVVQAEMDYADSIG